MIMKTGYRKVAIGVESLESRDLKTAYSLSYGQVLFAPPIQTTTQSVHESAAPSVSEVVVTQS
jgi:hypothetical protein